MISDRRARPASYYSVTASLFMCSVGIRVVPAIAAPYKIYVCPLDADAVEMFFEEIPVFSPISGQFSSGCGSAAEAKLQPRPNLEKKPPMT